MRTYANISKKYANTWVEGFLGMLTKSPTLFNQVVKDCDILIFNRMYSMALNRMAVIIIPRNDQSFQVVSEMWHEEVSEFCTPRNQEWTDEQIEVNRQIQDLDRQKFSSIFETIGIAMDAESRGVRPHSKAMESILGSVEVEQTRKKLDFQLQKEALQSRFDNLESSKVFVDSFDRILLKKSEEDDFLRLSPIVSLQKRDDIDLDRFKVYGTKFKEKCGAYLVHTKRPQKWAKPFRICTS